jgi:acetoin utilization deacetylase AcuC-like enzyme
MDELNRRQKNPESSPNNSLDPKTIGEALRKIEWLKSDPVLMSKLREITLKWKSVNELLLYADPDAENSRGLNEDELLDCSDPPTKRTRSFSDESVVEVKSFNSSGAEDPTTSKVVEPDSVEWECKKCTFLNADASTSCSICGWFRSRSNEAMVGLAKPARREVPVLKYIKDRIPDSSPRKMSEMTVDEYSEILSRGPGGSKEQKLTGITNSKSVKADCIVFASPFNLLACGQAQEESTWMNSLERDLFAKHSLDEELIFAKRWIAAKKLADTALESEKNEPKPDEDSPIDNAAELREMQIEYAKQCNSILGTSWPEVIYTNPQHSLSWQDWIDSGVHSREYLDRLVVIHRELKRESISQFSIKGSDVIKDFDFFRIVSDEVLGRDLIARILSEPSCDLDLHCLSHVEGDNVMDRFLIPASMRRADLIFSGLVEVWESSDPKTAFIAARPPGHHCPSFEDRLIGLSVNGATSEGSLSRENSPSENYTPNHKHMTSLEKSVCEANGLESPPREHGMGFCSLNALAVAIRRFQQLYNPGFVAKHGRSIKVAIVDLDIHAGNGTELVFRDNRSVLHISFHRYGWLKALTSEGGISERVMPGTHYYKDVGGIFGKHAKRPKGEGYSVNITLRKGDGNAEVLSSFEGVALPILQEFSPDIVVIACGFDGLKLSPVFKRRWGEESCPGMDAEYTPSLYGYIINRIRNEVQAKVIAATEGGYDPISVGLAARSVVKGLSGTPIRKPPIRVFNNDWINQLNNIFQHQSIYWSSL